jgi:hypothetical protein
VDSLHQELCPVKCRYYYADHDLFGEMISARSA